MNPRHVDSHSWPAPACAPVVPPQSPTALSLRPEEVSELRAHNRLDLELYDAVRAAFQLQLIAAKRTHGAEVFDLLAAARNGTLPGCTAAT